MFNNELEPNLTFKQVVSIVNQQVRPTAAVNVSSSDLSSDRSILDIDTLEHKYNSRSPSSVPSHLLQKIQQHPVPIQTTSTPING